MSALLLSDWRARKRPSVVAALSLAARLASLRPRGLPARVRNAEAAVARNHLLHAQLEGWDVAILVHGIPPDLRQCAPRHLVGLACSRVLEYCRCNRRHDKHDFHDALGRNP